MHYAFFLIMLPSLLSPLFPYTTLFRSDQDVHVLEYAFHALRVGYKVGRQVSAVKLHAFDYFESRLHRLGLLDGDDADRKSTRLNSSHLGISYAVFCLKKKIYIDINSDR